MRAGALSVRGGGVLDAGRQTELWAAARGARERAYAPYSGIRVGAAVLAADGRVFLGANVENASWALTICAERVALAAAVVAGATDIVALAVAADGPAPPCGACRQVIAELAPRAEIIWEESPGVLTSRAAAALLPWPFRPPSG